MRSLFLKIFLSFWLTVVLIGAALVVTYNLAPELVVSRWRAITGEALTFYAHSSAEVLERSGPAALQSYLGRLEQNVHVHAVLFDASGAPVSGSASEDESRLARMAEQSARLEFDIHPRSAVGAVEVEGPSGRRYVLAATMPRGPFARASRNEGVRLLVALVISGLICYLLATYLTRPILRLRSAATGLGAGDLGARAGPEMERRRDEIGELVRDFNRMAERIESLVTSQRRLISDISHELRSPLARLSVALGLARQRSGPEATPLLDRIEREAERLNEMIGRLLTLARLQDSAEPAEKERVDLRGLLEEVSGDAEFEAAAKGCTVRFQAAQDCSVTGNRELLRSAIENVVRNAIRYTPEKSEIEIDLGCRPVDGSRAVAAIAVRDRGPGLPESELDKVFRPFYRIAGARERQSGGTGLGLAITERAVKLHGGSVRACNRPGGGLEVEISLPATRA